MSQLGERGLAAGDLYAYGNPAGWTPLVTELAAKAHRKNRIPVSVDGVQVVKTIERLALTAIDVGGTYLGGMLIKNSAQCNGGASSLVLFRQLIATEKANSVVEIDQITPGGATECIMEGVTVQTGRVRTMPSGTYSCTGGNVAISDMRRTSNGGIELSWVADLGNGCTETGIFSGTPQQ